MLDIQCGRSSPILEDLRNRHADRSVEYVGIDRVKPDPARDNQYHWPDWSATRTEDGWVLKKGAEKGENLFTRETGRIRAAFVRAEIDWRNRHDIRAKLQEAASHLERSKPGEPPQFDIIHFHMPFGSRRWDTDHVNKKSTGEEGGDAPLAVLASLLRPGGRIYHLIDEVDTPLVRARIGSIRYPYEQPRTVEKKEAQFKANLEALEREAAEAGLRVRRYGYILTPSKSGRENWESEYDMNKWYTKDDFKAGIPMEPKLDKRLNPPQIQKLTDDELVGLWRKWEDALKASEERFFRRGRRMKPLLKRLSASAMFTSNYVVFEKPAAKNGKKT